MQIPMQLAVSSDKTTADLYIMGDIFKGFWQFEDDTNGANVVDALNALEDTVGEITVHINSYGGQVSEGVAIYNALKSHKAKVTTVCEGFACSIASVVFMAGDERVMRPASLLMLHNASMPVNGDANAHIKAAEDLETITNLSKTAYLAHATDALDAEKLKEVMDRETWVDPDTALEWGLATSISEEADEDAATQSARRQVFESLTGASTLEVLDDTRFDELFARADQLFTRMDELEGAMAAQPPAPEPDPEPEPDPNPDPEPEPDPEPAKQRYARLFQSLAR